LSDEVGGLADLLTRLADDLQEKAGRTLDTDDVAYGQSGGVDLGVKLIGGMKVSGLPRGVPARRREGSRRRAPYELGGVAAGYTRGDVDEPGPDSEGGPFAAVGMQ
jgi:hypothetical protein